MVLFLHLCMSAVVRRHQKMVVKRSHLTERSFIPYAFFWLFWVLLQPERRERLESGRICMLDSIFWYIDVLIER